MPASVLQSRMLGTSSPVPRTVAPAISVIDRFATSQPQTMPVVAWGNPITRGLYAASVPGFPCAVTNWYGPSVAKLSIDVSRGRRVQRSIGDKGAHSFYFRKQDLAQRTEAFFLSANARALYNGWLSTGVGTDFFAGGYSDSDFVWNIHGSSWNSTVKVFEANLGSPTILQKPSFFVAAWGMDVNSGIARVWRDGAEWLGASNRAPHTSLSVRSASSAYPYIYAAGTDCQIPLFLAWNRVLTDPEVASLSANPWQVFEAPRGAIWTPP